MRIASWLGAAALLSCVAAVASACGDDSVAQASGSGAGAGGAGGEGSTSSAGGGAKGATTLTLPQFVHGAAELDQIAFPSAPIVVAFTGDAPDSLDVEIDGMTFPAARDGDRFVATIDTTSFPGAFTLTARATKGGAEVATVSGELGFTQGSVQFTKFASAGPAYGATLAYDAPNDALALSWVDAVGGPHGMWLAELNGGFERIGGLADVALGDPADEPLDGHTAFGDDIGVVYRSQKPNDGHWLVKLRVVKRDGTVVVPTIDLTGGEAAFTPTQAGVDPGGYSGAWLHISPAADPNDPPPVEVRFSRWDTAQQRLVGPVTLDMDQPDASADGQGPQILEPLAELGIACNASVCVVTYVRDVYIPFVDINAPKVFVAVVDLASGALAGPPTPVEASDWDMQQFGQQVIALADGSFELVYETVDTAAAVNPKSPCDDSLQRDLLFAVHLDASGAMTAAPAPIFDHEGSREYPRIAQHPAGFAMLWEDQRSECAPVGYIRMASSVAAPDAANLLDPYLEWPDSVGLPPEDPTLAVISTNFAVAWSDDRDGGGVLDPKTELFLDTYWRQ
jgi:hypothetical protein